MVRGFVEAGDPEGSETELFECGLAARVLFIAKAVRTDSSCFGELERDSLHRDGQREDRERLTIPVTADPYHARTGHFDRLRNRLGDVPWLTEQDDELTAALHQAITALNGAKGV